MSYGVWVIEYRLGLNSDWIPNADRGCFAAWEAAEAACAIARKRYLTTEYRAQLYVHAKKVRPGEIVEDGRDGAPYGAVEVRS